MKTPSPRRVLVSLVVLTLGLGGALGAAASSARAGEGKGKKPKQTILLDGIREHVNFNDGDSFRILDGPRKGQKARLIRYNTLESYGPVHFWGSANGWDLYHVNERDQELAKSEEWECETSGQADGYGRILVLCPELRKRMIQEGLAHVYAYKDEPDPDLVKLMHQAQDERRGMWKYGVPTHIVTSIHSIDEGKEGDSEEIGSGGSKKAYNRVADTKTGKTFAVEHELVYKACDAFCHGGSCLIYVPFKVRFGEDRPACMRGPGGEKNRLVPDPSLSEPMRKD